MKPRQDPARSRGGLLLFAARFCFQKFPNAAKPSQTVGSINFACGNCALKVKRIFALLPLCVIVWVAAGSLVGNVRCICVHVFRLPSAYLCACIGISGHRQNGCSHSFPFVGHFGVRVRDKVCVCLCGRGCVRAADKEPTVWVWALGFWFESGFPATLNLNNLVEVQPVSEALNFGSCALQPPTFMDARKEKLCLGLK